MKDTIRRCWFAPYRKGAGPTFNLTMWHTHRRSATGQCLLGYRLTMTDSIHYPHVGTRYVKRTVLFEGEDFGNSPAHCLDSDDTVVDLLGFLTLRPGDTDREYFDRYTPEQMEFCQRHAEALAAEIGRRFYRKKYLAGLRHSHKSMRHGERTENLIGR